MRYGKGYSKYRSKKITIDGIIFDSEKEGKRYRVLKEEERSGTIHGLVMQKEFILIPAIIEESKEYYKRGPKVGQKKPGKTLEQKCSYFADFVYYRDGELVVEDTKGFRTADYVIKRKLMLYKYGIRIKEV